MSFDPTAPTVYVSGKYSRDLRSTRKVMNAFRDRGFTVICDWTKIPVGKPYLDPYRAANNQGAAEEMLEAAAEADIFVLLYHPDIYGALIELGAALAGRASEVYVVDAERESVFFCLPQVQCVDSLEEMFERMELFGGVQ